MLQSNIARDSILLKEGCSLADEHMSPSRTDHQGFSASLMSKLAKYSFLPALQTSFRTDPSNSISQQIMATMDTMLLELYPAERVSKAIVLDSALNDALTTVFEEIEDRYIGDFTADSPSDVDILLLLAKRCSRDSRFDAEAPKLQALIRGLSAMVVSGIDALKDRRTLDLQASSPSPEPTPSTYDALLSMQLALRLGEKVLVTLSNDNTDPMEVTLSGYPQQKDRGLVRLWFTFHDEMLSKRVRWERLLEIVSRDVWDLTGGG